MKEKTGKDFFYSLGGEKYLNADVRISIFAGVTLIIDKVEGWPSRHLSAAIPKRGCFLWLV